MSDGVQWHDPLGLGAHDRLGRPCKPMREWIASMPAWHAAEAINTLHGCRYPIGETRSSDFHFCNKGRKWPGSYCEEHEALCYRRYPGWGY
jgi:hypothetical protein